MSCDRNLVLRALGCPAEPNAKTAIGIVLESIHAEADALSDMDPSSVLQFALSRRIDALKEFVEQFVIVEWAEVSATNGCRRRRGE